MAAGTLPESSDGIGPLRPVAEREIPTLFVVLEGERPRGGGARCSLHHVDEVLLGRGDGRRARREGRRLTIEIPDARMSSRHARLRRTPRGFVLEDLGSRNGVLVDGSRVESVALADGTWFLLGRTLLRFREAVRGPTDAPEDLDSASAAPPLPRLSTLLPSLARELELVGEMARARVTVCVEGESGTGKELVARAFHATAARRGDFVAVNCAAIPATLVESELFGHKRGAFSGATEDRPGLIRAADGGTLFLDEIGDLPLAAQAALLRVLQERAVTPVGATRPIPVDVAVISATHRDLDAMVEDERFRADLFARLAGFRLALPPLRRRLEDFGVVVGALLERLDAAGATLRPDALLALTAHDWPLNVRELENVLRTGLAMARGEPLGREHLPAQLLAPRGATSEEAALEARLRALLVEHQGNISQVARAMGKTRMQIHRWLKRFQIDHTRLRR